MNIHEHQAKQILKEFGAVVPEGVFAFTVKDLIEKAEGLQPDTFMNRGFITRTNEDFSTTNISFNVSDGNITDNKTFTVSNIDDTTIGELRIISNTFSQNCTKQPLTMLENILHLKRINDI